MKNEKILLFGAIVLLFGTIMGLIYYSDPPYNFGNIEISKKTLNKMTEDYPGPFLLCEFESRNCFQIFQLKSEKEFAGPVRITDDKEYFRETGITRPKQ